MSGVVGEFRAQGAAVELEPGVAIAWSLRPELLTRAMVNMLPLDPGERITSIVPLPEDEAEWAELKDGPGTLTEAKVREAESVPGRTAAEQLTIDRMKAAAAQRGVKLEVPDDASIVVVGRRCRGRGGMGRGRRVVRGLRRREDRDRRPHPAGRQLGAVPRPRLLVLLAL